MLYTYIGCLIISNQPKGGISLIGVFLIFQAIQFILMFFVVKYLLTTYVHEETTKQYGALSHQIADVRAELLEGLGSATLKPYLSSYELERLEREQSFDRRIAELKEELAKQQSVIRSGISAEELHPLVKNLPHNIIAESHSNIPDVEYVD